MNAHILNKLDLKRSADQLAGGLNTLELFLIASSH